MAELDLNNGEGLKFDVVSGDQGSLVVRMSGDLDLSTVGSVEAAVEPLLDQQPERLVIDVKNLQFADSSGLALWVRWANRVDQVEIREPSQLLRRVIERMGLAERLRCLP
jgi:anti-anti-sigma factor